MAEILSFRAPPGHARTPVAPVPVPVLVPEPVPAPEPPAASQHLHDALRQRAAWSASACSVLLCVLGFGLALLVACVLRYDGALLGVGPAGLCIGAHDCGKAPFVHLGQLSGSQRTVLASALAGLSAPALMILAHLRGLFRLYAAGIVFDAENMARISRVGSWLLAYAASPLLMHRMLEAFALFPEQSWFRIDGAAAAIIGLSLLLVARVTACGAELEQRRGLLI